MHPCHGEGREVSPFLRLFFVFLAHRHAVAHRVEVLRTGRSACASGKDVHSRSDAREPSRETEPTRNRLAFRHAWSNGRRRTVALILTFVLFSFTEGLAKMSAFVEHPFP